MPIPEVERYWGKRQEKKCILFAVPGTVPV